jgi:ribosomal protein S18 acetylase RimI-like enzyme
MADAVIRPAVDEDVDPAYAVLEACRLGPWFELTREQFREWWPTYKQIWIAEEDAIVAFGSARGEAVEVYVLPEARRRGIGSRLLAYAEAAVDGLRVEATSRRDEEAAGPFLEAHGYMPRVEVWAMQIRLGDDIPEPVWPEGFAVRTFRPEEAPEVKELLDIAYAQESGFVPRSVEEWRRFMLGGSSFEPESWFVVEAADGSLAAAALNWKEGFVKDLVVHPAQRRRGLGAALLHHTFRHFRGRGLDRVTLKTDSANTSKAWLLYERVGMRTIRTYDEWEKRLVQSGISTTPAKQRRYANDPASSTRQTTRTSTSAGATRSSRPRS